MGPELQHRGGMVQHLDHGHRDTVGVGSLGSSSLVEGTFVGADMVLEPSAIDCPVRVCGVHIE